MYDKLEISLVVFMPNITTNQAITYTNSSSLYVSLFHLSESYNQLKPTIFFLQDSWVVRIGKLWIVPHLVNLSHA